MKRFFDGIKLHKQTPLSFLIYLFIFYVIGFGLLCLTMFTVEDAVTWFPMGTLSALMGLLIFTVIGYLSYPQEFMIALSMGQTRKEFLLSHTLEQLLWMAVSYVVIVLLAWLEHRLCIRLFPDAGEEFAILPILTDWRVILAVLPPMVLLHTFFGTLYGRFGKPFNVVMYVFWVGSALVIPRLSHTTLFQIVAIPTAVWIALGITVAGIMAAVSIHLGMKQQVR